MAACIRGGRGLFEGIAAEKSIVGRVVARGRGKKKLEKKRVERKGEGKDGIRHSRPGEPGASIC